MSLKPALFLHIQKTAGTTLVNLIRQSYGNENVISHGDFIINHELFVPRETGTELDVTVRQPDVYAQVPFVSGHFGFNYAKHLIPGRFAFTFLRNPVERVLSFYYFCRSRNPAQYKIYDLAQRFSLTEFLALGLHNPEVKAFIWNNQTWQLASGIGDLHWRETLGSPPIDMLNAALEHLDAFSYVGFAESYEYDRDRILEALGVSVPHQRIVSNATPGRPIFEELPKQTRDLLFQLTELDRHLYETAWARKNASVAHCRKLIEHHSQGEKVTDNLIHTRNYYLTLLQQCLTGALYGDRSFAPFGNRDYQPQLRERGLDWPERAQTMIGNKRLANLVELCTSLIEEGVPGDLIETGVWRGGACIMMRAILLANGDTSRRVWVADSFEGLPPGNKSQYPEDANSDFHSYPELAVSLEEVRQNFASFGLLDDQVAFLKGWFKDTLPGAAIDQLALIRLDGDMYESTMDALTTLYPKLSQNGYIIIDDYHVVPACKAAVTDYCTSTGINPEFIEIDGVGVYWKKLELSTAKDAPTLSTSYSTGEALQDRIERAIGKLHAIAVKELLVSVNRQDAELALKTSQLMSACEQLSAREQEIASIATSLSAKEAEIAAIHASTSWKLTTPIRQLGSAFKHNSEV
ncbi:sulfotransferase family 2 domain-containing protein [Methylobacillus flagellatus]|uniref:TylF/MycF/NovP-related O-methyltransferase n=1 Tax=Methylobacillus flagellatus TaxID=405 RepID=UPI002853EFC2|nr:TylF/MycF/NovP-related O-methyltransferase [Methylobacillus flagellatus]MDR5172939.1 sulfotransferase family 2 domain-containing protein [Methylobacillus flagellatus]